MAAQGYNNNELMCLFNFPLNMNNLFNNNQINSFQIDLNNLPQLQGQQLSNIQRVCDNI